jgi:hypothetical protein
MSIKKKVPKYFLKQIYKIEAIKSYIQYDYLTNYFCVLKESNGHYKINSFISENKMLKLHNLRYRA